MVHSRWLLIFTGMDQICLKDSKIFCLESGKKNRKPSDRAVIHIPVSGMIRNTKYSSVPNAGRSSVFPEQWDGSRVSVGDADLNL